MMDKPTWWSRSRGERAAAEPDTPLIRWLRAVLWGAVLVPAVAFVGAAWWGYRDAEREAVASAEHACELAWSQALRTFRIAAEVAERADAVSSMPDPQARAQQSELHQRLADMTAGVPFVVNLNVWDADGTPIVRSDIYPVDPRASVADRAYFQAQRERAIPMGISMVLKGRQTGREIANATIRRSAPDGSFRGIVAVSMNPGHFRDFYQSLASEEPKLATFALVRTDGEVIARWPPARDGSMRVAPTSPILAQIARGTASGSVVLPPAQGRETRLIAFRRLEGYPLYVTAGFSRSAMLAGWVRYVSLLAAIIGPITAVLVYVSWVALRKTRREQATQRQLQEEVQLRAKVESAMMETQKLETLALVTGGVAHDFNNLLAIVNTSLHVLKRRYPELGEEKQVKAMTRAVQAGVRLTRQLLSFSRKQALRPETVELQQWLGVAEGLIRTTLPANVSWQLQVDASTAAVRVDLGELELALINLVVNACHAMPQGGALQVHAGNLDGMVALSVRDEGVGIPPELLARVTEPFFTTRDRGTGSGLGLSQVQGFCVQAGGSLQIESEPGRGTCVRMLLPAVDPARQEGMQPAAPEQQQQQQQQQQPLPEPGGTVLLVEDNEDLASTTETMLRSAGLEVLRVRQADAALALIENGGGASLPDLVLSDIAMPGAINGIGLAFELRRRWPDLPVVLTTGYADQLSQAADGGFRVLPKPTAPEALLAELRAVLRARRSTQAAGAVS